MRWQIYGVWTAFAVSFVSLDFIIWKIGPDTSSFKIKVLFFIALFILVWSIATLVIFEIKNRFLKSRLLGQNAYESAFLLSSLQSLIFSAVIIIIILIRKFVL
ncbi:MAG: hypothetical protein HYT61_03170 [Candidatus Yanofskybacteria bacterium]|nr:hypothetical protein [Candidatus Yanofskybacteria bacterium]